MVCCGGKPGDALVDEVAAFRAAPEGEMGKVYSARAGVVLQVGRYGVASNEEGCLVPAAVAAELAELAEDGVPVYRVEFEPGEADALAAAADAPGAVATDETGSLAPTADGQSEPFHAEGGKVHHTRTDCTKGNDIEHPIPGTGDLPECPKCKKLADASAKE